MSNIGYSDGFWGQVPPCCNGSDWSAEEEIERDFWEAVKVGGWLYKEAIEELDDEDFGLWLEDEPCQREWFFENATGYYKDDLTSWLMDYSKII